MKIVFRNLPEGEGTVKVSLDGGNTFIDHQINTARENGIPLADNQDYSKILIKGPANILRNLDILSSVKVDGAAQPSGTTYKAWTWEHGDLVIYTKDGSDITYNKTSDNTVEESEYGSINDYRNDDGIEAFRVIGRKGLWYRTPDLDFTINEQTVGIPYTYEKPVYETQTVTYRCYAWDNNSDGQITEDDDLQGHAHCWVNSSNNKVYIVNQNGLVADATELNYYKDLFPNGNWDLEYDANEDVVLYNTFERGSENSIFPRYPEGDLTAEEQVLVGTETITETIKVLQDPPTITENGTVTADEGKAFKSATVEVPQGLGFKCFYDYAPAYLFNPEVTADEPDTLDSGYRTYNILMSNYYLSRMYKNVFPMLEYNGLVGIVNDSGNEGTFTRVYDTSDQYYNLFQFDTLVGTQGVGLTFYDSREPKHIEREIYVQLNNGEPFPQR